MGELTLSYAYSSDIGAHHSGVHLFPARQEKGKLRALFLLTSVPHRKKNPKAESPRRTACKAVQTSITVANASQPWSKSWPSGDDELVRLAYFPSIASRV